jgi:hypothetical protein
MSSRAAVFKQTRQAYLEEISRLDDIPRRAAELGFKATENGYRVPFFAKDYLLTNGSLVDRRARPAPFDAVIVICRYLIMCPPVASSRRQWTAFREFKDAAPLLGYFAQNAEQAIAKTFRSRPDELHEAARRLNGQPPDKHLAYDAQYLFTALPRIKLLLLFNDADEEFDAECRVLFERRAEAYLDMECVAILGAQLAHALKPA